MRLLVCLAMLAMAAATIVLPAIGRPGGASAAGLTGGQGSKQAAFFEEQRGS